MRLHTGASRNKGLHTKRGHICIQRTACPDHQDVLIFQVSWLLWDLKTKCVDYTGALIFKCPH